MSVSGAKPPKNLVGYADKLSVVAGDTIEFKISCYSGTSYRADLVRMICGDRTEGGAGFEEEPIDAPFAGEYEGRPQPINIGSYGVVDLLQYPSAADELSGSIDLTLQALVCPTMPGIGRQAVVGTWDDHRRSGISLVVADDGSAGVLFCDTDGSVQLRSTGVQLPKNVWSLVAVSFDNTSRRITLRQWNDFSAVDVQAEDRSIQMVFEHGVELTKPEAILFGAWLGTPIVRRRGVRPWAEGHYSGKIERPCISKRVLTASEILALAKADSAADRNGLFGCWDFSFGIDTTRLMDTGPLGLTGTTVNFPSRAVTGHRWDGQSSDWRERPAQYGAIHFHPTDLWDADWDTDFQYRVPDDLPSGVYCCRIIQSTSSSSRSHEFDEQAPSEPSHERDPLELEYIVFFVRPAPQADTAPIAFVASTATYMAYGNERIMSESQDALAGESQWVKNDTFQTLLAHPEFGLSQYDVHPDGDGVRFSSRLRPLLNMKPGTDTLWSFSQDTLLMAWLTRQGYRFDVVTDEDLDREGIRCLARHRVVITGSHPEYFSQAMRDAVDAFTHTGGRLMYLGGNGFWCNFSYCDDRRSIMEVRRICESFTLSSWYEQPGQWLHATDGQTGGEWRVSKRPGCQTVGAEFIGLNILSTSTHYQRTAQSEDARAAFVFDGVEGDLVNDFGKIWGAFPDEVDQYVDGLGAPSHTLVLATSKLPGVESNLIKDVKGQADMVFFECQGGGAVFSASSISWGRGLVAEDGNNNISRLTSNVLDRFLDPFPFEVPDQLR